MKQGRVTNNMFKKICMYVCVIQCIAYVARITQRRSVVATRRGLQLRYGCQCCYVEWFNLLFLRIMLNIFFNFFSQLVLLHFLYIQIVIIFISNIIKTKNCDIYNFKLVTDRSIYLKYQYIRIFRCFFLKLLSIIHKQQILNIV